MTVEQGRYQLSEEENVQIFEQKIVPDLLAHIPPQNDPILSVIIAQHGAGKTYFAKNEIMPTLESQGGVVDIDSDLYKKYHPAYKYLIRRDDTTMAVHTGPDGQKWMRQAFQYTRDHRQHTLVQETAQNPPFLAGILKSYQEKDFHVSITAIGVAESISRQSILKRYHEQRLTSGSGRLPAPDKIQASLQGMLDFADITDKHALADQVQVLRRGSSTPTYENSLEADGWRKEPGFRSAIIQERLRRLSEKESNDFLQTNRYLSSELSDEPKLREQVDLIRIMASKILGNYSLQNA